MITLRPYQVEGERKIREAFAAGFKAPIFVLPTGGGKTVTFASIAHSAQRRGKRVLILCHRVELVDQIVVALAEFDVTPDIIASGYGRTGGKRRATNCAVAVASVQTLVRRLESYSCPTLIIIDECHHVTNGGQWSQILRHYSNAKNLGFTATPVRTDGRGLAAHFDTMIVGPTVQELTADKWLVPARVFAPPTVDISGLRIRMGDYRIAESEALMDTPSITGDALSHYRKHADGKPALAFCTSVSHAHHVADRFRTAGVVAVALDGATDREVRRMAVKDFRAGAIRVLVSCDLFSEGFDVPGVHCGIMLRPTASEGLHRQQVGRILRPASGKDAAIILDHVGNCQKFGLPADPREWQLTADIIKRKKSDAPGIRVCPKCFAASPARAQICQECQARFETKARQEVEEKDGDLVELTAAEIAEKRAKKQERMTQGRTKTLQQLIDLARIKGYHENWAHQVFEARQQKLKGKENAQA